MASSSSQGKRIPFSNILKTVNVSILLLLLLAGSCSATRPGKTMGDRGLGMNSELSNPLAQEYYRTGFRYVGQVFSFLPKGVPIPPSGPSERHNSEVNSAPPN